MIPLTRILNPINFPLNFTGVPRQEWELDLLNQTREIRRGTIAKHSFASSRWKDAKDLLKEETKNKCAYCEVYFSTVAYGDVEHYRPKSKYWWLAYAYFNYLPSCQLCNQKYKKAKFPIPLGNYKAPLVKKNNTDNYLENLAGKLTPDPLDNTKGMPLANFIAFHNKERPFSLDPYLDDPPKYFGYRYNDITREVYIIPLNSGVEDITNSCIGLFGLNRKELLDLRYRSLLNYRFLRQAISDAGASQILIQAAQNMINGEYLDAKAQFCGMHRFFENKPIDPIPQ